MESSACGWRNWESGQVRRVRSWTKHLWRWCSPFGVITTSAFCCSTKKIHVFKMKRSALCKLICDIEDGRREKQRQTRSERLVSFKDFRRLEWTSKLYFRNIIIIFDNLYCQGGEECFAKRAGDGGVTASRTSILATLLDSRNSLQKGRPSPWIVSLPCWNIKYTYMQ